MQREIVLDTETTGLDPNSGHRVIEIGCVELIGRIRSGKTFHCYLNPQRDVPAEAFAVHGISGDFLKDKPLFADVAQAFIDFLQDSPLVIHNAGFDMKFINHELSRVSREPVAMERAIDTVQIARRLFPGAPASLDALCKRFEIDLSGRTKHGALLDAELLSDVYLELCGGRQTSLLLVKDSAEDATHGSTVAHEALDVPYREHAPTAEELAAHAAMLAGMKNPLWNTES